MAKVGFDFYRQDTNRYQDIKIKRLKKEFSCSGIAIYDYILTEIYRVKGCFIEWDESTAFDVAEYFGIKETLVNEVVTYCCNVGLFDTKLRALGVLTSKTIQVRYSEMCKLSKRKDFEIPEKIKLIQEETLKVQEEIGKSTEESDKEEKRIVENSREDILLEKESKEIFTEEKIESAEPEQTSDTQEPKAKTGKEKSSAKKEVAVRFVPPTVQQVADYCASRQNNVKPEKFVDFYKSKGWKVGKSPMKDWQAAVRTWENNNRDSSVSGFNQPINGKPPNLNEKENRMGRISQSQAEAFLNGN